MTQHLTRMRCELRARRDRRSAARRLAADLALFDSPADRLELSAVLARHDDAATRDLRRTATLVG